MPDEPDLFAEDDAEWPPQATDETDDQFNDAFKQGVRRAGMHWMRAGYEILAGVGAFLEELNQRQSAPDDDGPSAEHIELE